jgi:hypothetical protein
MDPSNSSDEAQSPAKDIQTTKEEVSRPPPTLEIPNGGFEAWTQVAGSFFLFFNGW